MNKIRRPWLAMASSVILRVSSKNLKERVKFDNEKWMRCSRENASNNDLPLLATINQSVTHDHSVKQGLGREIAFFHSNVCLPLKAQIQLGFVECRIYLPRQTCSFLVKETLKKFLILLLQKLMIQYPFCQEAHADFLIDLHNVLQ